MGPSSTDQDICLGMAISELPGMALGRTRRLERLGILRVGDLLRHLPMRYERVAAEVPMSDLPHTGLGTARGMITASRWVPSHGSCTRGRFEAMIADDSGLLEVIWFNAGYLRDQLHPGMTIRVHGKIGLYQHRRQMVNPKWKRLEKPDQEPASDERLHPIYPATENLSTARIERLIHDLLPRLLEQIDDPLPAEMMGRYNMPELRDAFRMAHQPQDEQETAAARRRLAFNELLLLQLGIALKRHYNEHVLEAAALRWSVAIDEHIRGRFPFDLTTSQSKVVDQITTDLARPRPMNRLLQGDVGSGKTVVALYAMLMAVANRKQAALMAPTELLAEQHLWSISRMLEGSSVRLGVLTSGQGATSSQGRRALLEQIEAGQIDLVVGTQALLTESVRFKDLALVVIDEQHRFGVMQRALLREGVEECIDARTQAPHCLLMTATPIPRTLSLTIFGDLDVSTIDQLPPGRQPVATRVVEPAKSEKVYMHLAQRLASGEQAYVVVPAIDESGQETTSALKNVRAHARLLQDRYCRGFQVAAIHGRLKRPSRESIMDRFRRGRIQVLVATTVIEVGVDVPNASVMIVEHAERFGLAQLHQLRGRVGRGSGGARALCVFIADPSTDEAARRMEAIGSTSDGFQIAEADLQIRGMGDFFGTRQHGAPPLRVAKIPRDLDLLNLARQEAKSIIKSDPKLTAGSHEQLWRVLSRQYGEALGLIDVG